MNLNDALDLIQPNIDSDGLIIHNREEWGGGDTAQREGMWYFGLALAFPESRALIKVWFATVLRKLEAAPGIYVRHPQVPGCPDWYDDPKDFSRDQSIPLIVAMGRLGLTEQLDKFHHYTGLRGFKAQNGDLYWWPYYLAMWIRAEADANGVRFIDYLNPILWLGDFSLILASIWGCLWGKWHPNHSDDVNYVLILLQSHVLDNPLAKLARWIYANYRTPIKGTYESWGPASALEAYFSPKFTDSGAPRIDRLYNESGILKNLIQ